MSSKTTIPLYIVKRDMHVERAEIPELIAQPTDEEKSRAHIRERARARTAERDWRRALRTRRP